MDGQQPSETQSNKNWTNMVGFITTAEALPNERSQYRRCFDQAFQPCSVSQGVRWRWSISGGSHLLSFPRVLLLLSSATCRAPESHHRLRSLAYQSTCSQSGRLLQRSSGWLATDSAELTMGQWVMGQWVEWVTKIGWVRWVMGHCSVTHDPLQKNNFYVNIWIILYVFLCNHMKMLPFISFISFHRCRCQLISNKSKQCTGFNPFSVLRMISV